MNNHRIERIAYDFQKRIREIPGVDRAKVYIFGSAVRDSMEEGSDIDLLVVLDNRDDVVEKKISDVAFRMSLENDILINEIVYSREVYESKRFRVTPLFKNIQKDGVPV